MLAKTMIWVLITVLLGVSGSRSSTSLVNLTAHVNRLAPEDQSQLEEQIKEEELYSLRLRTRKAEDILLNQQLKYTNSIVVCSTQWTEIPYYSREVRTDVRYRSLEIRLSIPYSGKHLTGRARVVLFFDGLPVADQTTHSSSAWQLIPLHFHARIQKVAPGTHKLVLKAAVDSSCLNIPHYNTDLMERTLDPPLTGSYLIVGHR